MLSSTAIDVREIKIAHSPDRIEVKNNVKKLEENNKKK